MNTKYEVIIYWSEPDNCFLAEVPACPPRRICPDVWQMVTVMQKHLLMQKQ